MEIPVGQWYRAIERRRSRRHFVRLPVEPGLLGRMEAVCAEFRPYGEARAVLVPRPADEVLRGLVGSYGQVKGAPAYVALVGDMRSPYVQERVGYTGQALVLEATSLGLGTCWVGGFFRPEVARRLLGVGAGEQVMAVIPFGRPGHRTWEESLMTGFARSHHRKPLAQLMVQDHPGSGLPEEARWPGWVLAALEAARLAPSAVNRQPWRFSVEVASPPDQAGCTITVSVAGGRDPGGISRRLDCGIAMLHIEVAALAHGVRGSWEPLHPPQVARFVQPRMAQLSRPQ
ncbi:MAG: nitroreductase family protein [Bacillota bacterium]